MERLLTTKEVANLLGVKPNTIRKYTMEKKIPFIKINEKMVRYKEEDIKKWLEGKKVIPQW